MALDVVRETGNTGIKLWECAITESIKRNSTFLLIAIRALSKYRVHGSILP